MYSAPVFRHALSLTLCLALLFLLMPLPVHGQADDPLEAVREAYATEQYQTTIALLDELLAEDTLAEEERVEALVYRSRAQLALEREDEARETLEEALAADPGLTLDPDQESPPMIQLYYTVRQDIEANGPMGDIQTLAVLDFANNSVDERDRFDGLRKGLPSMMISHMSGATDLRVIERERIQWLLEEQDFQQDASRVDQSTAVQTGQLLGANAVVFGSFIVLEEQMTLNASIVDVASSVTMLSEQVTGPANIFHELIADLSGQLSDAMGVELDAEADAQETRSLEAIMAYSQGLVEQEQGNYRQAYVQFVRASELDPGYDRARQRVQSLRPLIREPVRSTSLTVGYLGTDFQPARSTPSPYDFDAPLAGFMLSGEWGGLTIGYGTSSLPFTPPEPTPSAALSGTPSEGGLSDQVTPDPVDFSRQLFDVTAMVGTHAYLLRRIEQFPLGLYVPIRLTGTYRYVNIDAPVELTDVAESRHLMSLGLGAGGGAQFRVMDLPGVVGTPILGSLVLDGSMAFIPAAYGDAGADFEDVFVSRMRDISIEVRLVQLFQTGVGDGLGLTFGFTHRTIDRSAMPPDGFGDAVSTAFSTGDLERISTQRLFRIGVNW